jgi:hypothetical protein
MADNMSSSKSVCLERCYFLADNCRQKEDGTWDCKSSPSHCEKHCDSD